MAFDLSVAKSESGKATTSYSVAGLVFSEAGTFSLNSQNVTHLSMYCQTHMDIVHLLQES